MMAQYKSQTDAHTVELLHQYGNSKVKVWYYSEATKEYYHTDYTLMASSTGLVSIVLVLSFIASS